MANNNGAHNTPFETSSSYDEKCDGMGLERPSANAVGFSGAGSQPEGREARLNREISRFSELKAKAFGNPTINNAGVVLDSFGGMFGEGGSKPDVQGGANK